jgi:hypothetical protein
VLHYSLVTECGAPSATSLVKVSRPVGEKCHAA